MRPSWLYSSDSWTIGIDKPLTSSREPWSPSEARSGLQAVSNSLQVTSP